MIQLLINSIDRTDLVVQGSLSVRQILTNQVDTAQFNIKKYGGRSFVPNYNDDVEIYDGSEKIFGGKILMVQASPMAGAAGLSYQVSCTDHTYEADKILISRVYEDETISDIIADMVSAINTALGTSFTTSHVSSTFVIEKIVFNQMPVSQCIKKLADILRYDWYIDPNKDFHFFSKDSKPAPFDLTDTNGNYVYNSLVRTVDGSQMVNRVKVRGGEYNGVLYTDVITVKGNDSKSFKLPYRFANLQIELDTGSGFVAQDIGIDFEQDFSSADVLYNFQEQMIRFENSLADGNKIRFSGNPKVRVFAVAEDPISTGQYKKSEKLIRDDSIASNAVARRRASAELYAYAQQIVDAKFATYTPGLRAGMLLNIQSDIRGDSDKLIIKTITFKPIDKDNFGYQVECISTKSLDLIDLLQKILQPAPLSTDEVEVAEEIFTDTQTIDILEEYEVVTPFEDEQNVEISENTLLNPVDPANVVFVLAPYTPTSQTDPKRPGRLNISLKTY